MFSVTRSQRIARLAKRSEALSHGDVKAAVPALGGSAATVRFANKCDDSNEKSVKYMTMAVNGCDERADNRRNKVDNVVQ